MTIHFVQLNSINKAGKITTSDVDQTFVKDTTCNCDEVDLASFKVY